MQTPIDILKIKRKKIIQNFTNTTKGFPLKDYTFCFDNYFLSTFENSLKKFSDNFVPFSIIALGGYGREEMCIKSDIDILFLFEKEMTQSAKDIIYEFVYPLWNIKIDVGYSVRTLSEQKNEIKNNIESFTAFLDARFLCGFSPLYMNAKKKFNDYVNSKKDKIVKELYTLNKERHKKFGNLVNQIEPNLKNGQGGLRDYHTILWLSKILFDLKTKEELKTFGYFSEKDYEEFTESLELIFNVRNRLQTLISVKSDILYFEHQKKVAEKLGFKKNELKTDVEIFLSSLHLSMECIKENYLNFLEHIKLPALSDKKRKVIKSVEKEGLCVRDGKLEFKSSKIIPKNPAILMDIFQESLKKKINIGGEAKKLIKEFIKLLPTCYENLDLLKSFEKILINENEDTLALFSMLSTNFIPHFIPEFKNIEGSIQYNQYHLYPVDKHSIKTLGVVKSFKNNKEILGEVYNKIKDKKSLFWAALLHDIGKGFSKTAHAEEGAKIAKIMLLKMRMPVKRVNIITFLIKNHLLLVESATRRDVFDKETISFVASRVKNSDNLSFLYLLTIADSKATGPKAFTSWKKELLQVLFLKVNELFYDTDFSDKKTFTLIEKKRDELSKIYGVDLIDKMSLRYLLKTQTENIKKHIDLFNTLNDKIFVWDIKKTKTTREITFCSKNYKGLLSKVTSVLTYNNIDILNATIHTWTNDIAMNVFTVSPPPDEIFEDEKWEKIKKNIDEVLSGKKEFISKIEQIASKEIAGLSNISKKNLKVRIDNKSSSFFTIINIFAYDIKGLLSMLVTTLYEENLDIKFSIIASIGEKIVDSFYVTNAEGQKIENIDSLKNILSKKLENIFS